MKTAAVLSILVLLQAVASGAVLTQSGNFTFENPASGTNSISNNATALSTVSTPFAVSSAPITLNQFNPSLGTLNSVTFTLNLSTSQTSGSATFGTLGLLSNVSIARSISLTINLGAFTNPVQTSSATINQTTLLNALGLPPLGGSGTFSNIAGPTGFTTAAFTSPSQLTALTGTGTFTAVLGSSDVYTIAKTLGLGSYTLSGETSYSGDVTVAYNYTAVPEPASTGMILCAALLVGVVLRRRKAHAV